MGSQPILMPGDQSRITLRLLKKRCKMVIAPMIRMRTFVPLNSEKVCCANCLWVCQEYMFQQFKFVTFDIQLHRCERRAFDNGCQELACVHRCHVNRFVHVRSCRLRVATSPSPIVCNFNRLLWHKRGACAAHTKRPWLHKKSNTSGVCRKSC